MFTTDHAPSTTLGLYILPRRERQYWRCASNSTPFLPRPTPNPHLNNISLSLRPPNPSYFNKPHHHLLRPSCLPTYPPRLHHHHTHPPPQTPPSLDLSRPPTPTQPLLPNPPHLPQPLDTKPPHPRTYRLLRHPRHWLCASMADDPTRA